MRAASTAFPPLTTARSPPSRRAACNPPCCAWQALRSSKTPASSTPGTCAWRWQSSAAPSRFQTSSPGQSKRPCAGCALRSLPSRARAARRRPLWRPVSCCASNTRTPPAGSPNERSSPSACTPPTAMSTWRHGTACALRSAASGSTAWAASTSRTAVAASRISSPARSTPRVGSSSPSR